MINNIQQFQKLMKFENDDEVYILLAMQRAKDGVGTTQSSERKNPFDVKRRIVASNYDLEKHSEDLLRFAKETWENYRLYITYNPRSLRKAFYNMQNELMHNIIFKSNAEYLSKLVKLDAWWRTYLHRPEAKSRTQYHMLDVDQEEIPKLPQTSLRNTKDINVIDTFKTKNGFHLLCKPFNAKLVEGIPNLEFKQDAMLCLYIS